MLNCLSYQASFQEAPAAAPAESFGWVVTLKPIPEGVEWEFRKLIREIFGLEEQPRQTKSSEIRCIFHKGCPMDR